MKRKFICGILLIAVLLSAPFSQIDLASDTEALTEDDTAAVSAEPAADATEAPVIVPDTPASAANGDGTYTYAISSSVGTLTYYNQSDIRWSDYLYGGSDRMAAYGCGPTVMAMIVSSFTEQKLLPSDMADWASVNHYWAPQSGTKHNFIPDCAAAFGLYAESFKDFTETGVRKALSCGNILVALMGPGHLTDSGHFIIITNYWAGSMVNIADPASLENTKTPWDINLLLSELSSSTDYGGPVWMLSPR